MVDWIVGYLISISIPWVLLASVKPGYTQMWGTRYLNTNIAGTLISDIDTCISNITFQYNILFYSDKCENYVQYCVKQVVLEENEEKNCYILMLW